MADGAPYPNDWSSWLALDESQRRQAVAADGFWAGLAEQQQQCFIEEADWQEIRVIPQARERYLGSLVSLSEICSHLGLSEVQVYWLVSTRKLPVGALLDGEWRFAVNRVDKWVEQLGGLDAVKADVEQQMAEHAAASGRGDG